MVESQIRTADVTQPDLVRAFRTIPRERFVPRSCRALAYADSHVDLGDGRHLLRPRDFAKMVQAADIRKSDIVLDIGCGRGYSTAVLAALADTVVALETTSVMVERASQLLVDIQVSNAAVLKGDLKVGAPEHGPFDVIFINGAVEVLPDGWMPQLAEKGRLATIVLDGRVGRACLFVRSGHIMGERVLFDASMPVLSGCERTVKFAL